MTLGRFFRTPKGLLIVVMTSLLAVAIAGTPEVTLSMALPELIGAVGIAVLLDGAILRWRKGKWVFPDGAFLTGLFVAMIVSPFDPWYIAAVTTAIGVISKYVARIRTANVFNPAALALVATFFVFHSRQSWWGALPEVDPRLVLLLFAASIVVARRVDKVPVMLAFLGVYYAAVGLTAFLGHERAMAGLYHPPESNAALFFAAFMVTDPPTSPPRARDQLTFGAIVGLGSYLFFRTVGSAYFLLAGLLVGNVWEAWRRVRERSARSAGAAVNAVLSEQ